MAYALFAGEDYYPAGGMDDFVGVFESVEAARARFSQGNEPERYNETIPFDWAHIVDTATFTKVLVWAVVVEPKRATKTRPAQPIAWDWVAPRD